MAEGPKGAQAVQAEAPEQQVLATGSSSISMTTQIKLEQGSSGQSSRKETLASYNSQMVGNEGLVCDRHVSEKNRLEYMSEKSGLVCEGLVTGGETRVSVNLSPQQEARRSTESWVHLASNVGIDQKSDIFLTAEIKAEPQDCEREWGTSSVGTGDMDCNPDTMNEEQAERCSEDNFSQFSTVPFSADKSQERKHRCNICGDAFKYSGHLKTHMRRHTGEKPYKCETCGISFTHSGTLKKHVKIHTSSGQYACQFCDASFQNRNKWRQHCKLHFRGGKEQRALWLQHCKGDLYGDALNGDGDRKSVSVTSQEGTQESSVSQRGRKQHVCGVCGISFRSASRLKIHIFSHTGELPYMCAECGESFSRPDVFKRHQRVHAEKRSFVCKECGASFRENNNLKTHMRTHTGEKPFKCEMCDRSFTYSSSLKSHMFTHTGQSPFVCTVCGAAFTRSVTLGRHMKRHARDKAIACSQCGKTFKTQGAMRKHVQVHNSDKPHACKDCEDSFATADELKAHVLVHMVEKPFSCDDCGMCFAHASGLRQHSRRHTGDRPFKCDDCGASFTQAGNLNQHKRVHVGDTIFPCPRCGVPFAQMRSLTRHMNAKHQLDPQGQGASMSPAPLGTDRLTSAASSSFSPPSSQSSMDNDSASSSGKTLTLDTAESKTVSHVEHKQQVADSDEDEASHNVHDEAVILQPTGHYQRTVSKVGTRSEPAMQSEASENETFKWNICSGTGEGPFPCDTCGVSFNVYSSLLSHKLAHANTETSAGNESITLTDDNKLYRCRECGLRFQESSELRRHMGTHTQQKPHPCPHCSSAFTCAQDLKRHLRKHTGAKPFKCNVCQMIFCHLNSLKQHKRQHSGEGQFICDICGDPFTKVSSLNKHKQVHCGLTLYKCDVCEVPFSQVASLNRHMSIQHQTVETMNASEGV